MKNVELRMKYLMSVLLLGFAMGFLNGCASSATVSGMTVDKIFNESTANKQFREALDVESVTGGAETNPLWMSKISSTDFKQALLQSLKNVGFEANQPQNARYLLVATLKEVDQPFFGFDMTVTTTINYVLTDKVTKRILMNQDVKASGTATIGDAFFAVKRLRLANEDSAKQNIGQLLTNINGLSPDKVAISLQAF